MNEVRNIVLAKLQNEARQVARRRPDSYAIRRAVRPNVVFVPTFESSPLLEKQGLANLRQLLAAGEKWEATVEHCGPISPSVLLEDNWLDHIHHGFDPNLAAHVRMNFSQGAARAWFRERMTQDRFPEKIRSFNEQGQIPDNLNPFEIHYYGLLKENGVPVTVEPAIPFEAWYSYMDAYLNLFARVPQDFAAGELDAVQRTMEQAVNDYHRSMILRDEQIVRLCREKVDLAGRGVIVIRGLPHLNTLVPMLIAKGLSVEYVASTYRESLSALSPLDLVLAAKATDKAEKFLASELFLLHIAYLALLDGVDTSNWDQDNWQQFQNFAFSVPTEAVRYLARELAPKYNIRRSYFYRDFKDRLIQLLFDARIETPREIQNATPGRLHG